MFLNMGMFSILAFFYKPATIRDDGDSPVPMMIGEDDNAGGSEEKVDEMASVEEIDPATAGEGEGQ